jgi:hypothetical protein
MRTVVYKVGEKKTSQNLNPKLMKLKKLKCEHYAIKLRGGATRSTYVTLNTGKREVRAKKAQKF